MKDWLKQFPFFAFAKRHVWDFRELFLHGKSPSELVESLPLFAPGSATSTRDRAKLTLQCANQVFPLLAILLRQLNGTRPTTVNAAEFAIAIDHSQAAIELKTHFDRHGSDKASIHNYHLIYGPILRHRDRITAILEVGLGTNNPNIASNMGPLGRPGASLRAFRDFLPLATIYGADVDKTILFEEKRIKTYFVDQTNLKTFENLEECLGDVAFDLIIDDGLHSPNANLAVLSFAQSKLKVGGWVVIEDIVESASPFWDVIGGLLPRSFKTYLIRANNRLVFAAEKLTA